jgi:hypothetical protein
MLTLFRYYFNYFTKNNRYNSKIIVTRFADVTVFDTVYTSTGIMIMIYHPCLVYVGIYQYKSV